jgi:hypothetical protein
LTGICTLHAWEAARSSELAVGAHGRRWQWDLDDQKDASGTSAPRQVTHQARQGGNQREEEHAKARDNRYAFQDMCQSLPLGGKGNPGTAKTPKEAQHTDQEKRREYAANNTTACCTHLRRDRHNKNGPTNQA